MADDFRLTAQSIHEVDESKEENGSSSSGGGVNDDKKENNDSDSAGVISAHESVSNKGGIQASNQETTAAATEGNQNNEPVGKVFRSQSTYSMPVTNGCVQIWQIFSISLI